ncbi:MAG: hypothetical protein EA397_08385 [Deltaproteobacteria bacterium]|nr:MAG: hypothetical protein EA397_08385 [Deltaproteobacteria bacterium]
MLYAFLAATGLGGSLIVLSLLLGGGVGDADADFDADADADVDGPGGWLPVGSLRFWTFLITGVGLSGTLLTLGGAPLIVTLIVSIFIGVAAGWAAAMFFRYLLNEQVSAEIGLNHLVGREARVLLPVQPDRRGRILVSSAGGTVELTATTGDDRALERGEAVLIASIHDGVADVTRMAPAPRLAQENSAKDGGDLPTDKVGVD